MDGKYRCGSVQPRPSVPGLSLTPSVPHWHSPATVKQHLSPPTTFPPTNNFSAASSKLQVKREIFLEYDEKV